MVTETKELTIEEFMAGVEADRVKAEAAEERKLLAEKLRHGRILLGEEKPKGEKAIAGLLQALGITQDSHREAKQMIATWLDCLDKTQQVPGCAAAVSQLGAEIRAFEDEMRERRKKLRGEMRLAQAHLEANEAAANTMRHLSEKRPDLFGSETIKAAGQTVATPIGFDSGEPPEEPIDRIWFPIDNVGKPFVSEVFDIEDHLPCMFVYRIDGHPMQKTQTKIEYVEVVEPDEEGVLRKTKIRRSDFVGDGDPPTADETYRQEVHKARIVIEQRVDDDWIPVQRLIKSTGGVEFVDDLDGPIRVKLDSFLPDSDCRASFWVSSPNTNWRE